MNKYYLLLLVVFIFFAIIIPGPIEGKNISTFDRPLVVQFPTYGGYAPGIVYNQGLGHNVDSLFVKKFNLKVDLKVIDVPETAVSAFVKGGAGGGIDIMSFTIDMFAANYVELKKAGLDAVAIFLTSWSHGGDAIAASAEIKSPIDLRGKKIACAKLTPSHYYALYVLDQTGLSGRDVEWVFTQTSIDAANIFKAGRVDAAVSWAPDVYIAAEGRNGGHILSSTSNTGKLIGDIFIAKRSFAEKYTNILALFCQGWLEGVNLAAEKPDKAAIYLAEALRPAGVDKKAAEYLISVVRFANGRENLKFFELDSGPVSEATYRSVYNYACKLWRKYEIVKEFAPADDTIFVQHLKRIADKIK